MSATCETLRGLRILVVEDSFLLADDLCFQLEQMRCEIVGPTGQLAEAKELAREGEIDGAFLDVDLGAEGKSFPVARILAERAVPFVFLTGYDIDMAFPAAFQSVPRILKPFEPRALLRVLNQHFRGGAAPLRGLAG